MARIAGSLQIEDDTQTPARPSLYEQYRSRRNRLIAHPTFQRWAIAFPLTRWIARRQANDLFRLTTGFVHSQILHACVELGVFAQLADAPGSVDEIAARIGVPEEGTARLLQAAAALRLIRCDASGTWRLDDLGAVVAGNPGIRAMIRHHAMLYRDLSDPVSLLRKGGRETHTEQFWAYGRDDSASGERAAAYSDLMAASNDLIAAEVVQNYEFSRHEVILDIGGGNGAFLAAIASRAPQSQLWLFDLPSVAELAKQRFKADGIDNRATCIGGDFFTDALPTGADCVTLVRVLCDHDDSAALALLKNIHRAMRSGDVLLVAEPMAGHDADGSAVAAYFSMYFLAMRSGRCRTPQQLCDLLKAAGFRSSRPKPTRMPLFSGLILAHK